MQLVAGKNLIDVQLYPEIMPSPYSGYAWFADEFWHTGDAHYARKRKALMKMLGDITKYLSSPINNMNIDPSIEELESVISNPNNMFYFHDTHGYPCMFMTYYGDRPAPYTIQCSDIREWMKNRPPFRLLWMSSCYCFNEDDSGDWLPGAFTKDFEDPLSVAIGGFRSPTDISFCVSRFSCLFADPANLDRPLYDMFLDCNWADRDSWNDACGAGPIIDGRHFSALSDNRFYGSKTVTPSEIFS